MCEVCIFTDVRGLHNAQGSVCLNTKTLKMPKLHRQFASPDASYLNNPGESPARRAAYPRIAQVAGLVVNLWQSSGHFADGSIMADPRRSFTVMAEVLR